MIYGIGTDLVLIKRFSLLLAQHEDGLKKRLLSPSEKIAFSKKLPHQKASFLAKRFAAKEACSKALCTGIAQGVFLCDISVTRAPHAPPRLTLTGGAKKQLLRLTPQGYCATLHLSLSDDGGVAQAFVVLSMERMDNAANATTTYNQTNNGI